MRISDLGEFPLIDRVAALAGTDRSDVIVGIGDDVAVLESPTGKYLLAKVDSQVEDVHFLRQAIAPQDLGHKALAINLSDIAAACGTPAWALVSLALPGDLPVAWVEDLYSGMQSLGERYHVAIVGGNMARSTKKIFIDVFVLGHVAQEHLLLRSGAQPGDHVLVTGSLGDAAAGLSLLLDPQITLSDEDRDHLLSRHFTPPPRLPESAVIARTGQATSMIDLSDGLSSDVGHICERSAVGVRLWCDRLPVSAAAGRVAAQTERPAWQIALAGGEDYELCFTVPAATADDVANAITEQTGTPVTTIGEIVSPDAGRQIVLPDGTPQPLASLGWDHFKK